MTPEVTRTDPEGIDYGWVMQVTFVLTIIVGAPVVAIASLFASVPTWGDRAMFAVRVGATVWLVTGIAVFLYARQYRGGDAGGGEDGGKSADEGRTEGAETAEPEAGSESG